MTDDEECSADDNGNDRQRYEKGQDGGGGRLVASLFHERYSSTRAIVHRIISRPRLARKDGIPATAEKCR